MTAHHLKKKKKKEKQKEKGIQEAFVSSVFQFRHLWLLVQSDHAFFPLPRGEKNANYLKAPSIFTEFVQI